MSDAWFSPREIVFSRPQNMWLIEHLNLLHDGIWPPSFEKAIPGRAPSRLRAPFEIPCQFAAEIELRLKKGGLDGKLLLLEIQSGIHSYEGLSVESRWALNYISLWDFRKRPAYASWKAKTKYRLKDKIISFAKL